MRSTLLCAALLLLPAPLAAQPEPDSPCGVVGKVLRQAVKTGAIARVCTTTHFASPELLLKVSGTLLQKPTRLRIEVESRWKDRRLSVNQDAYELGLDGRIIRWGDHGLFVGGLFRLPRSGTIIRWSDRLLVPDIALVLAPLADQGLPQELAYARLSPYADGCGALGVVRRTRSGLKVGHPDRPTILSLGPKATLERVVYPSAEAKGAPRPPLTVVSSQRYTETWRAWQAQPRPGFAGGAYGFGGGAAGASKNPSPVEGKRLKPWRVALTRALGKIPEVSGRRTRRNAIVLRADQDGWTLRRWIPPSDYGTQRLSPALVGRLAPQLQANAPASAGSLVYERRGRHVVQLEGASLKTPRRLLDAAWAGAPGAPALSERLTLRQGGGELSTYRVLSKVSCPLPQASLQLLFGLRLDAELAFRGKTLAPTRADWVDPSKSDRARFTFPSGAVLEVVVAEGGGYVGWARSAKALAKLKATYAKVSGGDPPFAVGLGAAPKGGSPR